VSGLSTLWVGPRLDAAVRSSLRVAQ